MSKIRIDLETALINGQPLTFQSPADCSQITGLIVYYPEGNGTTSKDFKFVDAHGVDVGSGTISLFAENVLVKVVLDTDQGKAYVQNADTNAYLEGRFLADADGFMQKMLQMLKGDSNVGIMNGENKKIFGYGVDSKFYTGDPDYPLTFRGSGANPTYNGQSMPKIQTGTYQGTKDMNTDANDTDPKSLTFNFAPKLVFIGGQKQNSYMTIGLMFPASGMGVVFGNAGSTHPAKLVSKVTISGNTVSWTYTSTDYQFVYELDWNGITYHYVAIG